MNAPQQPDTPANPTDSGLECLVTLARFHGIAASAEQLRHELAHSSQPFGRDQLLLAARQLGLLAKAVDTQAQRLAQTPLPAIAEAGDGTFFILARVDQGQALIQVSGQSRPQTLALDDLTHLWSGRLILLRSQASIAGDLARFDFTWFIPAIVKYRKLLGEILLASFCLQLFALITPLFFQVVMDKVLVHRGLSTLDVLCTGLLTVLVFESLLSGLRSYVFAHTASRIDVELGSRLYRHLIALPLAYFHARRVGDSVSRVRELENIRSFLTGNAITLLLDLLFCVLFIAVMLFYSGWLTLVVILSLPAYGLLSLFITPPLRARLQESFNRGDVIIENPGDGYDSIEPFVNSISQYTLPENIDGKNCSRASGNISLTGNSSDNIIIATNGDNLIIGEKGNDTLQGNGGSDTYIFNKGDSSDRILEAQRSTNPSDIDILKFGQGINFDQPWFSKDNFYGSLVVSLIGASDRVSVEFWYPSSSGNPNWSECYIEKFQTSNGKTLNYDKVDQLVNAMASFSPPQLGQTTLPSNYQQALTPIISAVWS